ncbi:MAG: hypothetical protein ABW208_04725 [Pyrinomonadaceae bacterium]
MKRTAITITIILSALTLSARGGAAREKPPKARCQMVSGHITDQPYVGAECASPLGQCSAGRFYGVLKGDFVASATSFTPSADTATTGVISFTADLVLHAKDGDLFLKDAGTFNTTPGARGEHATVTTVTGGTGRWAGASGRLLETGTFTQEDGGYSVYSGEICTP